MSQRGNAVSDIVAQLVTDARREKGLSTDELADRAGLHPAYVGLLERGTRQPTLAAAAALAEALGLSLSALLAAAEREAGNGGVPEIELVPVPRTRGVDHGHLGPGFRLAAATELTSEMVAGAIEFAYRRFDLIDQQMREPARARSASSSTRSTSRRRSPTCSARASRARRTAATCRTDGNTRPTCSRSTRACRSWSSKSPSKRPSPPAARAGPAST